MVMGPQKRINYQSEPEILQGAKRLIALHPNVKSRVEDIQHKARQPLKAETHAIYKTTL